MKEYNVIFYPSNRRIRVKDGENLLRAAIAAEVHINAFCGGDGTCGKCRVIVEKGIVDTKPTTMLSTEEIKEGYVLTCSSAIKSDLEVRVPIESRLADRQILERERRVPTYGHILSTAEWEARLVSVKLDPAVRKVHLRLKPPSLDDSLSDLSRIERELSVKHHIKNIITDISVARKLPDILRQSNWDITGTLLNTGSEIILTQVEPGDTTSQHYGVAIDVGTTSIVARLMDLNKGHTLAQSSDYNAQMTYGEDVITRIIFAMKKNGLVKLQSLVISTINGLIERLIKRAKIKPEHISVLVAAGNTTMTHLFLGLNPKYIREEPYIPAATSFPWVKCEELGIDVVPQAYLHCSPCVASYVGGDITAGILASNFLEEDILTLYTDVGTNGEMVLGCSDWLLSCSCSAGPAFEGGGIKHGMRATRGAIEQIRIDPVTLEPMIITVGLTKPLGICGSGLIDAVAELFLAGVINQKGKMNLELETPRVRKGVYGAEYVLAWANETATGKNIVISEADIDNLMRAKAAVFAGITVLVESLDLKLSDIENIIIAGAFGNYLEIDKAITIGLLPELPMEKFIFIGNGSLLGACFACLSREMQEKAKKIAEKMSYLDLSASSKFMERYISALFLPHTNVDLFPSMKGRIKALTRKAI